MGQYASEIMTASDMKKQVLRAGTSNYIPQRLRGVISCPCPRQMLLAGTQVPISRLTYHSRAPELNHHWFRWWLVACSAPSHHLNQCWIIINWAHRNKLQWNLNQNTQLFIHENASENILCEMVAVLSRGDESISFSAQTRCK